LTCKETVAYLQFLGAAGTVTGSKHLINTRDDFSGKQGLQVLIDCGLFRSKGMESAQLEVLPFPQARLTL